MTFTECWFDVAAQATLAELVRASSDIDGLVIEIGAWEGRSTVVLAEAASPRIVHTCDTWRGSPSDVSGSLAAERDVFAQWRSNVAHLNNVVAHRMGWREYVPTITEPVAFCFIDAEHTYAEVFDNIVAIAPLMPSGAILCGDDIRSAEVARACADALGEFREHGAMWSWVKP